jgi:hypothetical protein
MILNKLATTFVVLCVLMGVAHGQTTTTTEKKIPVLTSDSKWAIELVTAAKADVPKLETKDDANAWCHRAYENKLVSQFYFPEGTWKKEKYQIALDDMKAVLSAIEEFKELATKVNEKFGLVAYDRVQEELERMISDVKLWSTEAWRKDMQALDASIK